MSLNRITLVGRLTRDPELKYTPNGIEVATMGVAVNRFTKNDDGEYEVDFFNVVAWRRSAKFASDYLTKGRLVSIDGRLQCRSWVDQATGQKRTAYEIVAENIQGLDRRPDGDNEEGHPDADYDEHEEHVDHSQAQPLPTSGGGTAVAPPPARAAAPKPAAPKGAAQAPTGPSSDRARPTASTPAADSAAARAAKRQALLDQAAALDAGEIDESDPFADD